MKNTTLQGTIDIGNKTDEMTLSEALKMGGRIVETPTLDSALTQGGRIMETPEQAAAKAGGTRPGSAMNRFFGGAAMEAGVPQSSLGENAPPLDPKIEAVFQSIRSKLNSLPPGQKQVFDAVYGFIEPELRNTLGQAFSGNVAGALGAGGTLATSYGAPKLFGKTQVPKMLERSAARSYGKVLAPTKEVPKAIAESKVIPGAIERGIIAGTEGGLEAKVAGNLERSGAALEKAWANLPPDAKVSTAPIWNEIAERIQNTYVKGTNVLENPELKAEYELIAQKLKSIEQQTGTVGSAISAESARSWRQLMDKYVASKPGGFAITKPLAAEAEAKKITTNRLRATLAEDHPDIATLNADYSFWRNFNDILEATASRRTGQSGPLGRKIVLATGAAAGLTHGPTSAVLDAALVGAADKLFSSTGWRTISAVLKDRLAQALANGDVAKASVVMRAMVARIGDEEESPTQ